MRRKKVLITIATVSLACLLSAKAVFGYSGSAKVYYNSNLSEGLTSYINYILNHYGYTSSKSANPSMSSLYTSLCGSHNAVFIHTHGNVGYVQCSDGNLYASDLSQSLLGLAYISACYSSSPSNSSSSFRGCLASLGVPRTIGFKSTISASNDVNGIHYFNYMFFYYYFSNSSTTLTQAVNLAKQQLYDTEGGYYGADNIEYSGYYYGAP